MLQHLWVWLVIQTGSVVATLLGIVMAFQDGTVALLPFALVAVAAWIFRPKDWRDVNGFL